MVTKFREHDQSCVYVFFEGKEKKISLTERAFKKIIKHRSQVDRLVKKHLKKIEELRPDDGEDDDNEDEEEHNVGGEALKKVQSGSSLYQPVGSVVSQNIQNSNQFSA